MRFILCLAAVLAQCQSARIPRGIIDDFPHFHSVHHGHGATSYQNVHVENYGSVPIQTEDHNSYNEHHHDEEQPFIIHVPNLSHHEGHNDISHTNSDHENGNHYIDLEHVPVAENGEGHHVEQHNALQIVYYGDDNHHQEYEYH